ncbi:hypothetical protein [Tsukamurella paurometabola]|uniref:Uncharacterized protein n=1 Tax=Tsukamurella paurometabola TaxID=2061 RepID=A0ABS5NEV6_TSUPA|nr:hypothetical protein [Tsukamurella paurometabola]MBS4102468.1 hypothetical protein [Tsukamurella paurometabola]
MTNDDAHDDYSLETYEVIRFFNLTPNQETKDAIRAALIFAAFHSK